MYEVIEWEEGDYIFKDSIEKLFNARLDAKSKGQTALSNVLKLIMNSSYGKILMKYIETHCKVINDCHTFDKYLIQDEKLQSWGPINEEQMIMEFKNEATDNDIKTPAHLGCFILSYSKRINE